MTEYLRLARLRTPEDFHRYIQSLGIDLPFDEHYLADEYNALRQPYRLPSGRVIGNRFCVLPMEGWDGSPQGLPTDLVFRRWRNFGRSGAKLIWGGEATAVTPDGRANPNQLVINASTMGALEKLRLALVEEHLREYSNAEDLYIGLQLTHSGRFCRPNDKSRLEPKIVYHHPMLDELFGIPTNMAIISDAELDDLTGEYIRAASQAQQIGFDFVDIKHCHGYLGHELLSAFTRQGKFGGSFENRTRFLRQVVEGIQRDCPGLDIGVRFSAADYPPFRRLEGVDTGQPLAPSDGYPYAFGGNPESPLDFKLDEPIAFLQLCRSLHIHLVNITLGSPYYNPHITRPAYFAPSDGYPPPEDPIVGVARHIQVTAALKEALQEMGVVGSGYSYLQEWLPNVAQCVVRSKMVDFVGLGRMMLSYPEFIKDTLAGNTPDRKRICRTFSDCTTAPRNGLVSGCFPLDDFYKRMPAAEQLKEIKGQGRQK